MTKLQQSAIDAIVRGEVKAAHVATGVRDIRITYTDAAGHTCTVTVGNQDCVILELASISAQPAGVYEVHEP